MWTDWQQWLLLIIQAGQSLLMAEIIISFILISQNSYTALCFFQSMCTGLTQFYFPISLPSQGCVKMHNFISWSVMCSPKQYWVKCAKVKVLVTLLDPSLAATFKYSHMATLLMCPHSLYRLFCHFTVRHWTTSQATNRVLSPDSHLILQEDFLLSNNRSSLLASHRYEFQVVCYVIL